MMIFNFANFGKFLEKDEDTTPESLETQDFYTILLQEDGIEAEKKDLVCCIGLPLTPILQFQAYKFCNMNNFQLFNSEKDMAGF